MDANAPKFKSGDKVKIVGGPLYVGQIGIVKYCSPEDDYVFVRLMSHLACGFKMSDVAMATNSAETPAAPQNPSLPVPEVNRETESKKDDVQTLKGLMNIFETNENVRKIK